MFLPSSQVVVADCQAGVLFAATYSCVDQRWYAVVVHRAARPAAIRVGAAGGWRARNRQVFPMHQVVADGVAPMNSAVKWAIGIVLVEHVIAAQPLNQAVWVVEPAMRRQEVIARPLRVGAAQHARSCVVDRWLERWNVHIDNLFF